MPGEGAGYNTGATEANQRSYQAGQALAHLNGLKAWFQVNLPFKEENPWFPTELFNRFTAHRGQRTQFIYL